MDQDAWAREKLEDGYRLLCRDVMHDRLSPDDEANLYQALRISGAIPWETVTGALQGDALCRVITKGLRRSFDAARRGGPFAMGAGSQPAAMRREPHEDPATHSQQELEEAYARQRTRQLLADFFAREERPGVLRRGHDHRRR